MGDVDQVQHAFPDALAVEVGDAVFGHDIVDVAPRRHDARAFGQTRYDSGYLIVPGCGGHGNDRFSPSAACGAANEVDLPADAAVEPVA